MPGGVKRVPSAREYQENEYRNRTVQFRKNFPMMLLVSAVSLVVVVGVAAIFTDDSGQGPNWLVPVLVTGVVVVALLAERWLGKRNRSS